MLKFNAYQSYSLPYESIGIVISKVTYKLCAHGYILWISILKQWPQSFKVGWCGDNNLKVFRNFQSRKIVHIVYESFPVKLIYRSDDEL